MTELAQILDVLHFDRLDDAWVQEMHDSEFLEVKEFPSDYETVVNDIEMQNIFSEMIEAINSWLNEEMNYEEKSWAMLSLEIDCEKLIAFLHYYIYTGTKNVIIRQHRNYGLFAARTYLKLLSVPGCKAYNIYHSQILLQSLCCLSYPKLVYDSGGPRGHEKLSDINSVIRQLSEFVMELKVVIAILELRPDSMHFEDIMSGLVEIMSATVVLKLGIGLCINYYKSNNKYCIYCIFKYKLIKVKLNAY